MVVGPHEEARQKLLQYQQMNFPEQRFFFGLASATNVNQATQGAYHAIGEQLQWLPEGAESLLRELYRMDRTAISQDGKVHALAILDREAAAAQLRKVAQQLQGEVKVRLVTCQKHLRSGAVETSQDCMEEANKQLAKARDLFSASQTILGGKNSPSR